MHFARAVMVQSARSGVMRGAVALVLLAALVAPAVAFLGKTPAAAAADKAREVEASNKAILAEVAEERAVEAEGATAAGAGAAAVTPLLEGGARHLWCTEALCTPETIAAERAGTLPHQSDVAAGRSGRGYPYWNKTDFTEELFARAMWSGPAAVAALDMAGRVSETSIRPTLNLLLLPTPPPRVCNLRAHSPTFTLKVSPACGHVRPRLSACCRATLPRGGGDHVVQEPAAVPARLDQRAAVPRLRQHQGRTSQTLLAAS